VLEHPAHAHAHARANAEQHHDGVDEGGDSGQGAHAVSLPHRARALPSRPDARGPPASRSRCARYDSLPREARAGEAVEARRAAIEVAGGRLAPRQLASLLGISTRRLHSMTAPPSRPALVDAIDRRQLHLLQQLGGWRRFARASSPSASAEAPSTRDVREPTIAVAVPSMGHLDSQACVAWRGTVGARQTRGVSGPVGLRFRRGGPDTPDVQEPIIAVAVPSMGHQDSQVCVA